MASTGTAGTGVALPLTGVGIALPNPASVALHERLGFRQVAHFAEVGHKFGAWIDVGYWQLMLGEGSAEPPAAEPYPPAPR